MHNYYELYFGDIAAGGQSRDGERFDVPVAEMLATMLARPGGDSGLLPPVVKAFTEDMRAFIVERPPTKVNTHHMLYTGDYKDEGGEGDEDTKAEFDFELALPWMVYLINLSSSATDFDGDNVAFAVHAFARPEQIFSEADELFSLPLPNISTHGEVCFENAADGMEVDLDDLTTTINMIINCFWASPANEDFNHFLWQPIPEFKDLMGGTTGAGMGKQMEIYLEAWSRLGINEVLNLTYHPMYRWWGPNKDLKAVATVGDLMQYMEDNCTKKAHSQAYYPGILINELTEQAKVK